MRPLLNTAKLWLRVETAKVLLSLDGKWIPEASYADVEMPSKVKAQLILAKKELYERIEAKREKRKKANRRGYIRRKLKQPVNDNTAKKLQAELDGLAIGKTKPTNQSAQSKGIEMDDTVRAMLKHISGAPTKAAGPKALSDYLDLAAHPVTQEERVAYDQSLAEIRAAAPRDEFGSLTEHYRETVPSLGVWVRDRREKELEKQRQ